LGFLIGLVQFGDFAVSLKKWVRKFIKLTMEIRRYL